MDTSQKESLIKQVKNMFIDINNIGYDVNFSPSTFSSESIEDIVIRILESIANIFSEKTLLHILSMYISKSAEISFVPKSYNQNSE